ncbi:MAG TPA: nucleoside deaminase [Planctomycetes bacterium]|nr:nucleoside deaminase [Planctomycetota bacterium]
MRIALEEAHLAFHEDEVPVGAVIVGPEGNLLARAHNRTRSDCDPTAHAEVIAIRRAARALGYQRLVGCTLYSTLEPCFLCAGALIHARLARVVFGARDPKFGGVVSLGRLLDADGLNHRVLHEEGLGAEQAGRLLRDFFRSKR